MLDHPGLNTSILEFLTSSTFVQITTIHVFVQSSTSLTFVQITTIHVFLQSLMSLTWSACILFYLPHKGSLWDTEFCCPLVMADLSQSLGSRMPPPHLVPPWSLALLYNHVVWDQLWVPPHTLLTVLFKWSCTNTINTCILHIFDVFDIITIYSTCILNILWHTFVWRQPRCISWWRSWWSMRSHLRCIPPLGWLLHKIIFIHFLVLPPWGLFCSRHFYEHKLTNSNNNHELRNNAVQWLSSLMRGLLRIIMHDTFLSMRKVIAQHHFTVRGCYLNLWVCVHKNVLG